MVVKLALKRKNENIQIWSRYSLFKNTGCSLPASSSAALIAIPAYQVVYLMSIIKCGTAVEVWQWLSILTPHFIMNEITCPCWDNSYSMLVKRAPRVNAFFFSFAVLWGNHCVCNNHLWLGQLNRCRWGPCLSIQIILLIRMPVMVPYLIAFHTSLHTISYMI